MKKLLLAVLFLVAFIAGCPTGPVDVGVPDAAVAVAPDAGHRVGSFNPTPTGTGFPHVTSGVQDSASVKVDTTNAAHVTVPSTANGVVTSSGTVLQQAANVLAGSGFVSIGATPAASGDLRLQGTSALKFIRAGTDYNLLGVSAGSFIVLGDNGQNEDINLRHGVGNLHVFTGAGNMTFSSYSDHESLGFPLIGETAQSSPWSVHGKVTVATTGTFSLAAAAYALDAIMLSGGTAGTVTFPTPSDDAHAYYKTVINTSGVTKTLTDGGATTPTLATALSGHYLCDTAGMHLTGPSVAYP